MNAIAPANLPVAVIGAGPVGLAAAARLVERGLRPAVFEKGGRVGAAILEWGHVRVFSCCGGPAPAGVDACCVKDAIAKDNGEAGCGCSEKPAKPVVTAAGAACCRSAA